MFRVTAPLFFLNATPKGTDIMELETLQALHVDEQARGLQAICRSLGVSPKGKKCVGTEGLLKEAS